MTIGMPEKQLVVNQGVVVVFEVDFSLYLVKGRGGTRNKGTKTDGVGFASGIRDLEYIESLAAGASLALPDAEGTRAERRVRPRGTEGRRFDEGLYGAAAYC